MLPAQFDHSEDYLSRLADQELEAKWREFQAYSVKRQELRETVQRMLRVKSPERRVRADDIPEGGLAMTKVGKKEILLAKVQGKLYAMDNACGHSGYPLNRGRLDGYVLTCAWHNASFDVRTGQVIASGMALAPLKLYQIAISAGGDVAVKREP